MKRFQECNKIEKLWRYRWYLTIPFLVLFYLIFPLRVYEDEEVDGKLVHTDNYTVPNLKMLWRICVGTMQIKMNWTYTMEEVMDNLKDFKNGL
jgi:hypothetical protein